MAVAVGEPAAAVVGSNRGGVDVRKLQNAGNTSNTLQWETSGRQDDGKTLVAKDGSVWNTKRLGSRVAVDAASAMTAGGLVAPIITMIDK